MQLDQKDSLSLNWSPQQTRIRHWQAAGHALREQCVVQLSGGLAADRLVGCLEAVLSRHGLLPQLCAPGAPSPLRVEQWQASESAVAPGSFLPAVLLRNASGEPGTGHQAPVLVQLIDFSPERHWLVVCVPAHLADCLSLRRVVAEACAQYYGRATGLPGTAPIGYARYAAWQHDVLTAPEAEATAFRDAYLCTPVPPLALPFRGSAALPPGAGLQLYPLPVSAALWGRLRSLPPETGAEAFVLAAWVALLHKHSQAPRIGIGEVVLNRPYEDLRATVGPVAKVIPLHFDVTGEDTAEDLLERLRNVREDLLGWQEVLHCDAGTAFAAGFQFVAFTGEESSDDAGRYTFLAQFSHPEPFRLKLFGWQDEEQLQLACYYDPACFRPDAIEILAGQYLALLEDLLARPRAKLTQLNALTADEKTRILARFNPSPVLGIPGERVVDQFSRQAALTPDCPAVRWPGGLLTYRQLDERSNRLAHYLLDTAGVQPGQLVAVLAERSAAVLVGVLAVHKAGAAYVPIDPAYPAARVAHILHDARPAALLTESALLGTLPAFDGELFALDLQLDLLDTPVTPPAVPGNVHDLAYVIYTSGSTGTAKGCQIEQHSLANYVDWANAYYFGDNGPARFGLFTSLAFDFTVTCIFCPLVSGGEVYVYDAHTDIATVLADVFGGQETVDAVKLTPSHIALLPYADVSRSRVRKIIVGGEELLPRHLDVLAGLGPVDVYNEYGPTEATVGCIVKKVDCRERPVRIGRPIRNTRAYILDPAGELAPIGVTGELALAGAGLARAYLNQPALTAARFRPDPFCPGELLYHTGDLCRWHPDGEIEYLGRNDNQVKIDGYRVEPGEVERHLLAHQGVAGAVVAARKGDDQRTCLAAYFVAAAPLGTAALRSFLADRLPAYLIPAHFVQVPAIPLTVNGKVDFTQLPDPTQHAGEDAGHAPPANDTEEKLAAIWAQVLGRERVGVLDNFFTLGGNSLRAVQIAHRVEQEMSGNARLADIFKHQTVRALASRLGTAVASAGPESISRLDDGEHYDVSPAQRRLWVLRQLEAAHAVYNMPGVYALDGPLELPAFERALGDLVRRHESLRTTFLVAGGELRQRVGDAALPPLEVVDLRPGTDPYRAVPALACAAATTPFDLEKGPLVRLKLLRLGPEKHVFLFTAHHIISDGWSVRIMMQEVQQLYAAYVAGRPNPLAPLRVQYRDYAAWQLARLTGDRLTAHRQYWATQLGGEIPVLDLPADRPRPAAKTFDGATLAVQWDAALYDALQAFSIAHGSGYFAVLLSAVQALLFRYTGAHDLVVGTTVAGRGHLDVENQVGFYVNTLALRTRLTGDETFPALLGQVQQVLLEAYEHQAYPFDQLVEELRLRRDPGRSPLFDVLVEDVGMDVYLPDAPHTALRVAEYPVPYPFSKYDLTFKFSAASGQVRVWVEYNTNLFGAERIEALLGHLGTLLQKVLAGDRAPVGRLDFLAQAERTRLLAGAAGEKTPPVGQSLVSLFEAQAARCPGATAVVCAGESLSYAQLDEAAGRLATYLRTDCGVQPGEPVAVLADRSERLLVALLGILKAGAAFVPVDAGSPEERCRFLLDAAGVRVLLADSVHLPKAAHFTGELFALDIQLPLLPEAGPAPCVRHAPGDLAYVLFTSGSTGHPKGVAVTMGSLVNYLQWANRYYFHGQSGVPMGLFTSVAFDLTLTSLFSPLLRGDTLHVYGEGEAGALLLEVFGPGTPLRAAKITPSHVNLLALLPLQATPVATVILGGEALLPGQVAHLRRLNPAMRIYNEYGPTEATVGCTVKDVTHTDAPVTIGTPIANAEVYVLTEQLGLQGTGLPGELYIGGDCLAKEYLGQPGLTAEKFVPHPFRSGSRLYRTGDRGRWNVAGELEYGGRQDQQVKLKGYRIEPGEIEQALCRVPGVEAAVVTTRTDEAGEPCLVAYYAAAEALPAGELREHLGRHLPAYMIPARLVAVTDIPVNRNGKVDFAALPDPSDPGPAAQSLIAPRDAWEDLIAAAWREVLGRLEVGMADNFFSLGGDSIKAIRVVGVLQKKAGKLLEVKDLFIHQDAAGLAAFLSAQPDLPETAAGEAERELADLREAILRDPAQAAQLPSDREDFYPMSDIQKGMLYHSQLHPGSGTYHDQLYTQFTEAGFRADLFHQAFSLLAGQHAILRTSFNLFSFSTPMQVVHHWTPGADRFAFHDLRHLAEAEREAYLADYLRDDRSRPLAPETPGLWRVGLFRLTDEAYGFLFICHHAIIDGWSYASLLTELSNAYYHLKENPDHRLTPLKASYKDYVSDQLRVQRAAGTIAYWQEQLAGYERTALPFNRLPDPSGAAPKNAFRYPLPAGTTQSVQALSRRLGISVRDVFLGAFALLLRATANQSDLTIGVVTSGRPEGEDGDKVLGCFLNTVPFRLRLPGAVAAGDLLREVSRQGNQMKAFDKLSLARIVEATGEKAGGQPPLFDVVFHYVDFHVMGQRHALTQATPTFAVGHAANNTAFNFMLDGTGGNTLLTVSYETGLYAPADLERLAAYFLRVIGWLTAGEGAFTPASLLDPAEQHRLLSGYNATKTPLPDTSVVTLFERQVAASPAAPALRLAGRTVTYAALNGAADAMAALLRTDYQVQPGDCVALRMERSEWLVIALLGVLKAGAAFLPIDPAYPEERRRYLCDDGKVKVLVVDSWHLADLGESSVPLLAADVQLPGAVTAVVPPGYVPAPEAPAYLIYTSGSTGQPKGVGVSHRSLLNYVTWANRYYFDDRAGADFALFTSISFDLTLTSIFTPLLRGDVIVIFQETDPALALAAVFDPASGVRAAKLTPSHLYLLGQLPLKTTAVDKVIVGGEVLLAEHVRTLRALNAGVRIYNEYGPTETTVGCTVKEVTGAGSPIPIGTPIANTRVYVLDEGLGLLPEGVTGEICVAGAGVALGYHRNPAATAARFTTDPFAAGGRLYRTGDRGRWNVAGELEYAGRADGQVKIHGYRIELGEVKHILAEHPALQYVEVDARPDAGGILQLVAYVVCAERAAVSKLWEHIRRRLPAHAWPVRLVRVAEIPLTAHGKIDYRRLTDAAPAEATDEGTCVPPRNELERTLVAVWESVLGRSGIGVTDNFFEIGGHSLNAMQIVARIGKQLSVGVELKHLFEASTVEKLAVEMGRLQPGGALPFEALPPLPYYEVSPAQRRLWILQQFEGQALAYHMTDGFTIRGKLDVAAFGAALDALVARHESLRTSFHAVGGQPHQRIHAHLPAGCLRYHDCPGEADPEAVVADAIARERDTPFDLEAAPLLRTHLLRVRADEFVFLFTIHHIISDNWSVEVITKELTALYNARCRNQAVSLPPLRVQYKEYAAWQNQQLAAARSVHRDYWLGRLTGELPRLDLPTDYPRPAEKHFVGDTVRFALDPATCTALEGFGQQRGASLFMVLTTAVKALLYRYTGQQDVIVGVPAGGRDHADLENQVGCYVNVLPLRTPVRGEEHFGQVLDRVKGGMLELLAHQVYPFDVLVDDLRPERDPSRSPVFDVMVVMQHLRLLPGEAAPAGIQIEELPLPSPVSRFDVTFNFIRTDTGVTVHLDFDTALFTRSRMERAADHFRALLDAVRTDPSPALSRLGYLSAREQEQLVTGFNDVPFEYSPEHTVHGLIEKRAALHPGRVALVAPGGETTYGQLNGRANRLARCLQQQYGVGRGEVVGVRLANAEDLVTGLLAIWKAGGVYLPINPDYPAQRAAYLLADSGAKVLLCAEAGYQSPVPVCPLYAGGWTDGPGPSGNLPALSSPEDTAYIIYTSGSTGQPKGVPIAHRSLADRLLYHNHYLPVDDTDAVLQFASVAFDASLVEIGMALVAGGRLVLTNADIRNNLGLLLPLLTEHRVTTAIFPPAYLKIINRQPLPTLRKIISTGEAAVLEDALHYARQLDFFNGYGPTETCVGASFCKVDPEQAGQYRRRGSVPIGRPFANTSVYVLDGNRQLLPVGVPGEMWVSGIGLTRGYLNNAALTAEKFAPNPFGRTPDTARMYRTGDLGRWDESGTLQFLGRADDQVQIHGIRVEPGEVKAALERHELVKEAWVTAGGDARRATSLTAYVVPHHGGETGLLPRLKAYLQGMLPASLIPGQWVELEALPRTANGKVDRRSLPEASAPEPIPGDTPRNPLERTLAAIWREVLALPAVGIHQNFFEAGGNSLKAIQVISRLSEELALRADLKRFFQSPTIAGLAEGLQKAQGAALPPVVPVPGGPHFRVSPAQQRLWLAHQHDPGLRAYNVPVAYVIEGPLHLDAFDRACQALFSRHEVLRTVFVTHEGEPRQRVQPFVPGSFAPAYEDWRHLPEGDERVAALFAASSAGVFDLESGPLCRLRLIRLGDEKYAFLLLLHHIVCDGWSVHILIRELLERYTAFAGERPDPLEPLPVQYKDYAQWLLDRLAGEEAHAARRYWHGQLGGELPVLALPAPYPRPPMQTFAAGVYPLVLDTATGDALRHLGRQSGSSLFMTLLTSLKAFLHIQTGQADLIVGSAASGRDRLELENQVGCYLNTLALRTRFNRHGAFTDLLAQVKATTLSAYCHQLYPFENLVSDLNAGRDRSRNPLFDVGFTFNNQPAWQTGPAGPAASALRATPLDTGFTSVKCDIWVNGHEEDGGIVLNIEYNTDLYDAPYLDDFAAGLRLVCGCVGRQPGIPLAELTEKVNQDREHRAALQRNLARNAKRASLQNALAARKG